MRCRRGSTSFVLTAFLAHLAVWAARADETEGRIFNAPPSTRTCSVRLMHRGHPLQGIRISVLAEETTHRRGLRVPATDASGRMTIQVDEGHVFKPYLETNDEEGSMWVLADIDGEKRPDFCRHDEVFDLPNTLIRVHVSGPFGESLASVADVYIGREDLPAGQRFADRGVIMAFVGTGKDDTVEIPGLEPGRWTIYAHSEHGTKRAHREIVLRDGDTLDVKLSVALDLDYLTPPGPLLVLPPD